MFEWIIGFLAFLRAFKDVRLFLIKRKPISLKIIKGAEPFFYKRGKKGILLIHGFTSSPRDMLWLGKYLAKKGITVYCPLLKHHGTAVEELLRGSLKEWDEQIIKEMNFLKKHCSKVYIGGSSFGGNLALIYASKNRVNGILSYGTPIFWKRERFYKSIILIIRQFKIFQKKNYDYEQTKVDKKIIAKKIQYDQFPLPALFHVFKAANVTKKRLKNIKDPVLVAQSTTDHVVDKRTPGFIYEGVSSKKKELFWMNDAYHVFLIDENRGKSFAETYKFIKNN